MTRFDNHPGVRRSMISLFAALAVGGFVIGSGGGTARAETTDWTKAVVADPARCSLPLLDDATIRLEGNISIENVSLTTSAPGSTVPVPEFCRVIGVARPSSDSNINFEVWLPTSTWNGKYLSSFEGGFAGLIIYPWMVVNLQRGYATAATDTGHVARDTFWMVGHPERVTDYGYRGKHLQTVAAKALIEAFYGTGPKFSYFNGCSNGGRQGLMELQRYPDDYDGYIIGAPANNWTGQTTYWMWMNQAFADPASLIADAKLPAIQAAALAQCDALDGVIDNVITDPRACNFNPDVLACPAGEDNNQCLTPPQLTALKEIYQGPRNSAGRQLFPPDEPGAEAVMGPGGLNFSAYVTGPNSARVTLGTRTVGGMLYNTTSYDPMSFNFDVDPQTLDAQLGPILNATSPDLRVQKAKGIKVLHYHGWNDAALAPRETIKYYQWVASAMGGLAKTRDFYRLYMVPGMVHCSGGLGPNTFGQHLAPFVPSATPQEDIVKALEQWVEQGVAPDHLIATKYMNDSVSQGVVSRRPLCPFPQVQRYNGSGDPNLESNFTCVLEPLVLARIPKVLNLSTTAGRVVAVLSVEGGGPANWNISDVRVEGVPALTRGVANDGRSFVVTFMKKDLLGLPAGDHVGVTFTGTLERDGVPSPFETSTAVRVLK